MELSDEDDYSQDNADAQDNMNYTINSEILKDELSDALDPYDIAKDIYSKLKFYCDFHDLPFLTSEKSLLMLTELVLCGDSI